MLLESVSNRNNNISARIEVYKITNQKINKKVLTFKKNDEVYLKTDLPAYTQVGFITDIDTTPGQEAVYFSGEPSYITLLGAIEGDLEIKRIQIRKTINEHLDRELKLNPKGIKC